LTSRADFAMTTSAGQIWNWHSVYPAPAKLNLFLHVVGRRADGYHLLQTLFRFLGHGDRLRFAPRADGAIRLVTPLPGVPPESDLTVRAARLLQAAGACRKGVEISIDKQLPMGGGLGGGSSDAATVLLALNHLWQLGLPRQQLQEIGLQLGADVPVFIFGRNAFAEGVGETLQAVDLPARWYLVLEPPLAVATAAVFAAPELKRDSLPIGVEQWQPGFGGNDLETVAAARYPVIAEHLGCLSSFAPARMSGSGACVFAEFEGREQAEAALRKIPAKLRAWVAAGLAAHPLRELASE
jgi:4-diphosphocytidyl-2-C-methyl-D-erythritol kinase